MLTVTKKDLHTVRHNMYTNNKMLKSFVIRLYFQYTLYMFRTVSVHLQEQSFYKLNFVFRMCGYVWLLCCYKQRHSAYKKLLLKMDWYSPKHVQRILKIKSNHKNFVHLVGYIHIAIWCTVHAMSNRQTQLTYVIYFIVATCFDLIRSSSGH